MDVVLPEVPSGVGAVLTVSLEPQQPWLDPRTPALPSVPLIPFPPPIPPTSPTSRTTDPDQVGPTSLATALAPHTHHLAPLSRSAGLVPPSLQGTAPGLCFSFPE